MPKKIDWERIIPVLGNVTDREVSAMFNISRQSVVKKRNELNISPCRRKDIRINWDRIDPYIGKMSDYKVAKMFNIADSSVTSRRYKFKIPSFNTLNWDDVLFDLTDKTYSEVAEKYNVSVQFLENNVDSYNTVE